MDSGGAGPGASPAGWPPRTRRYPPGPKGYQRSDERIREDICERLMRHHHIDSSEVTVEVKDAKVVLEGTVPDRRMKHAIEDLADACLEASRSSRTASASAARPLELEEVGGADGGFPALRNAANDRLMSRCRHFMGACL